MGMSRYSEMYDQVMSYLNAQDWESAYSLVKTGKCREMEMPRQFWQNSISTV